MVDVVPAALGNLITNQDLSSPYWTLGGYFDSGANHINEIALTGGTFNFGLTTPLPRAAGTGVFTHSVDLVKVGTEDRWLAIGMFATGLGSGSIAFFNVKTGVVNAPQAYGGFGVPTATMTALPGGGYHCSITADCSGGPSGGITVLDQDTNPEGTFNYDGVVTDGYIVSNLVLLDVTPAAGFAATPVVIMAVNEATTLPGPTTPYVLVAGPVLDGPATPIAQVLPGRPMLPGKPTPMQVVTGRPVLPGKATPIA